ncbi:MAG: LytTR family transcriptional regulator DNA-binding domain-containing protein [Bacteroidaceae bacterium]|nr:LytTR family transcriptional regulator DNA-binding domain-containing protein [Bacteroidaceae bacterium]
MRTLVTILYWMLSVVIAALVVSSAGYDFPEAILMGTMFLPGALAAKYLFPKVSFKKRSEGILNVIYIVLAILVLEYLLIYATNIFIHNQRMGWSGNDYYRNHYNMPSPGIIVNPVFISILVSILAIGGSLIDRWLTVKHPEIETPVTFCSMRKKVTLLPSEIVYVESCDTEVIVHASDGRALHNRTPISQWEALLGPGFVRIHRAFLVNSRYAKPVSQDTVSVADTRLPVSRKYQSQIKDLIPNS